MKRTIRGFDRLKRKRNEKNEADLKATECDKVKDKGKADSDTSKKEMKGKDEPEHKKADLKATECDKVKDKGKDDSDTSKKEMKGKDEPEHKKEMDLKATECDKVKDKGKADSDTSKKEMKGKDEPECKKETDLKATECDKVKDKGKDDSDTSKKEMKGKDEPERKKEMDLKATECDKVKDKGKDDSDTSKKDELMVEPFDQESKISDKVKDVQMDKKATDTDELDVNGNPQGDMDIRKKAPVSGDEGVGKRVSFLLKTEDIDVSGDLVIDENITALYSNDNSTDASEECTDDTDLVDDSDEDQDIPCSQMQHKNPYEKKLSASESEDNASQGDSGVDDASSGSIRETGEDDDSSSKRSDSESEDISKQWVNYKSGHVLDR